MLDYQEGMYPMESWLVDNVAADFAHLIFRADKSLGDELNFHCYPFTYIVCFVCTSGLNRRHLGSGCDFDCQAEGAGVHGGWLSICISLGDVDRCGS